MFLVAGSLYIHVILVLSNRCITALMQGFPTNQIYTYASQMRANFALSYIYLLVFILLFRCLVLVQGEHMMCGVTASTTVSGVTGDMWPLSQSRSYMQSSSGSSVSAAASSSQQRKKQNRLVIGTYKSGGVMGSGHSSTLLLTAENSERVGRKITEVANFDFRKETLHSSQM